MKNIFKKKNNKTALIQSKQELCANKKNTESKKNLQINKEKE